MVYRHIPEAYLPCYIILKCFGDGILFSRATNLLSLLRSCRSLFFLCKLHPFLLWGLRILAEVVSCMCLLTKVLPCFGFSKFLSKVEESDVYVVHNHRYVLLLHFVAHGFLESVLCISMNISWFYMNVSEFLVWYQLMFKLCDNKVVEIIYVLYNMIEYRFLHTIYSCC